MRVLAVNNQNLALGPGIITVVANAIAAAGALAQTFVVLEAPTGAPGRDITFIPDTLTAMTTLTVDLEASSDGGTTWAKFQSGMALIAASVPAAVVVKNVPSGLIFRLNPTTFTGTLASIVATVS